MWRTLREGGSFACKLFDVTLSGTIQVVALLAPAFEQVALVKPVTSRPASSERYMVRGGLRRSFGRLHRTAGLSWSGIAEVESVPQSEPNCLCYGTQLCLRRRSHGDSLKKTGQALLESMLRRAQQGLCDGVKPESGREHLTLLGDPSFRVWLRASNDRLMQCQIEACTRIVARLEAWENGEDVDDDESGRQKVDLAAFREALMGLEQTVSRTEREEKGASDKATHA